MKKRLIDESFFHWLRVVDDVRTALEGHQDYIGIPNLDPTARSVALLSR